jgi:hypothetical protein
VVVIELLYQMADGLLRVASTDVAKSKNPASPRGYFFALYKILFFSSLLLARIFCGFRLLDLCWVIFEGPGVVKSKNPASLRG